MAGRLAFRPLTEAVRADFEALFGAKGGPGYCWCMVWRATPDERKRTRGPDRRAQMRGRIKAGPPPGLVAYLDGEPVGWVSVAPKDTFLGLGGREDTDKVFSLTCMFVARSHRGDGLSAEMIAAAAAHAKKHGAEVLEAYPVDPESPSYRFMGFVPAFERAGFTEDGRVGKRRHVMHLGLT